MNRYITLLIAGFCCASAAFAEPADSIVQQEQSKPEPKGLQRYFQSLVNGNVDHTHDRAIDMTYAISPAYTREGGIGFGGAITALYRLDRQDTIMQPSDLQLSGSYLINNFFAAALRGHNYFKGNKNSIIYDISAYRRNEDFWGITYADCAINPVSKYTRQQIKAVADFTHKLTEQWRIGGGLVINYTDAARLDRPEYLNGERHNYFLSGVSATLQYDTRDFVLNPKRGIYVMLKETLYPQFTGNYNRTLLTTTFQFNAYQKLWRDAVLGYDLYGEFNSKHSPWTLREELGSGACRMRGYYAGRYIDNCIAATQLELRQHIYKRIGCAVWGATGTVFPSLRQFKAKDLLPNYGIGFRFEIKHNVNMRVDYGFGRNTSGLVVQMAESF